MKTFRLAGLALAAALLGATSLSAKPLVFCSEGSPDNFSPALNTSGVSFDAARPVYNRLVEFERGSTKLTPGLAESWTVGEEGRVYTFQLRKGVKFHAVRPVKGTAFTPKRDFNAEDVLFAFARQGDPKHPFHKVSGGRYDYYADMGMNRMIKSVEKIDDHAIRITLAEPNVAFLATLAMDFMAIPSAEYAAALRKSRKLEQFDAVPVGTGPFSFVEYRKDEAIRYRAFPDHAVGEKARVDELVFAITPDAAARAAKVKAGECHVMTAPRPADLPDLRRDPALTVLSQPGLNVAYLAWNVEKAPFDRKEARQAFNMAIDKAAILREVYAGSGEAARNLIPPTLWSFNDAVQDYPHDPERARALLEKAGVKTPLEIELWHMPVQRAYNPNSKRAAEMMKADLAKIGVHAKLVTFGWGEYLRRAQAGEHHAVQLGWMGDNGDPDHFFFLRSCAAARPGGQNLSKWCDKDYDALFAKARSVADPAERAALYRRMQEIEREEAPDFKIAHALMHEVVRKDVEGYKPGPLGEQRFEGVSLK